MENVEDVVQRIEKTLRQAAKEKREDYPLVVRDAIYDALQRNPDMRMGLYYDQRVYEVNAWQHEALYVSYPIACQIWAEENGTGLTEREETAYKLLCDESRAIQCRYAEDLRQTTGKNFLKMASKDFGQRFHQALGMDEKALEEGKSRIKDKIKKAQSLDDLNDSLIEFRNLYTEIQKPIKESTPKILDLYKKLLYDIKKQQNNLNRQDWNKRWPNPELSHEADNPLTYPGSLGIDVLMIDYLKDNAEEFFAEALESVPKLPEEAVKMVAEFKESYPWPFGLPNNCRHYGPQFYKIISQAVAQRSQK